MNYNLVISSKKKKSKNNIYLDHYLYSLKDDHFFNKKKNINFHLPIPSKKEELKKIKFCKKTYNVIIGDLRKNLNKIHETNLSLRAWEIIVGRWLTDFIQISFRNYLTINKVLKSYKIKKILCYKKNSYRLNTLDTMDTTLASMDNKWNAALNSEIINFITKKNILYLNNPKIKYFEKKKSKYKISKINFLKKNIKKLMGIFRSFVSDNQTLIYKTNFPFFFEKKLEIKLNQFPQNYEIKPFKNNYKFDELLRKKIQITSYSNKSKFINFLEYILPKALPNYAVESFKKMSIYTDKINFPKKPKNIFTSLGFAYDEIFKIYVAKKVDQGSKYFVCQHGNNYFSSIYLNNITELKTSDNFFSWGRVNNKKSIPLFNTNTLKDSKTDSFKSKLTIVQQDIGKTAILYSQNFYNKNEINSTFQIYNNFSKKIQKETIFKLHDNYNNFFDSFYYKKYFENKKYNLALDSKYLQQTKIFLFTYESTGLLENLNKGIPSVCYLDNSFHQINNEYIKFYKLLLDAKIIFFDQKKLINHIEKYWDNLEPWWNDKKVRKNIDNFNLIFNNKFTEKKLKKLVNILKK